MGLKWPNQMSPKTVVWRSCEQNVRQTMKFFQLSQAPTVKHDLGHLGRWMAPAKANARNQNGPLQI